MRAGVLFPLPSSLLLKFGFHHYQSSLVQGNILINVTVGVYKQMELMVLVY